MPCTIPISRYVADDETKRLVNQVLDSGRLSQGPMVEEAEQLIADISNVKYCVMLSSGTVALEAMIRGAQTREQIVKTSPLTFRGTVKAIENAGLTPQFMDVDPHVLCIQVDDDQYYPFEGDEMIMPVDLYGRRAAGWEGYERVPCVLRDSCQAIGIDVSESLGAAFSFYPTKNVGGPEGGCVVSDDEGLIDNIRILANQGMRGQYEYVSTRGFNWRSDEITAAILIPQLKRIVEINGRRRAIALKYIDAFRDLPWTQPMYDHGEGVFHQFILRHEKRDEIVNVLNYLGVGARVYYPELVSPKDQWEKTPVALQASKEVFSIPVHQHLTNAEVDEVIEKVVDVVTKISQ
jgi:perosamine synthetase